MADLHGHLSAEQLNDYLRGELDPEVEADVEAHIGSCLVCARSLREEAQLEMLMLEAVSGEDFGAVAPAPKRRPWWKRMPLAVANSAAAVAALLMVVNPGQPLSSQTRVSSAGHATAANVSPAMFVNDALCFPSAEDEGNGERCEEPLTVAMLTDPDDYLSPFDPFDAFDAFDDSVDALRTSALNACLVEDLACEPG